MADFIAVIRRAVDGLSNNTPEMRARVYEKARSAVVRQLENMSPRPPEHMLQRQLEKLDAAIREVESEHAEALPAVDDVAAPAFEPEGQWQPEDQAEPEPQTQPEPQPVWMQTASEPVSEPEYPAQTRMAEPEPDPAMPAEDVDHGYGDRDDARQETPAPSVTGDDWADAHMSEPAPEPEPQVPVEEPVEVADRIEPEEPVAAAETAPAVWSDPDYGITGDETDYAGMYDAKVFGDAEVRDVASVPEERPEPVFEHAPEPQVETASQPAEPAFTGWADAPQHDVAAEHHPEPVWGEVADHAAPAEAVESPVEPEAYAAPAVEPKSAVLDAVDDWLQSRAADPTPVIPPASWDLPPAVESAANRVPELPEIDTAPVSVSYTPTDEFPAYDEPVRVEVEQDFPVPAGLRLEDSQPDAFGTVASAPAVAATAASVEPDDFSQWFRDNVDAQPAPASSAASATDMPATPEWDAHLSTFSPDGKGPVIDQDNDVGRMMGGYDQPAYRLEPKKRRSLAPIILGAVGVLLIAGIGYAGWTWRDDIGGMVASLTGEPETATDGATTTPVSTTTPPAEQAPATSAPATSTPATATATPADEGAAAGQKFTQRLRADGTEIDEGAGAAPAGSSEEGRSVSAQTVASTIEPTDVPVAQNTPTAGPAPTNGASTASPIAGGEKLFLYEERIGQATPVAVPGSITWTAVRETGADGKPDPQIQGKINVPDRGISALVTIKRNTDNSLPASHIIEVVFSVPADFEGGAIDNLQRIAMKRTEQDRGDPLVAVTAKVTDDTYLVALNDFADVVKRNMELLSTRGWIDIPVTYRNGRRALLTFDKGTQGANVFQQVMREWDALAPATPAN
ncbi:hypothetical protein [Rhizobium sp. AG855]|uniref:hypothetical protein n=1 Tax=Rhizobium sp. AG855 TaxID=2183898 RepID=UPI000E725822|nr:hypothetical protein [Rhizobium sp. AG855]RKE83892.1 hypothetical protein DFO46_0651 [Rhizobium sp. AG855]